MGTRGNGRVRSGGGPGRRRAEGAVRASSWARSGLAPRRIRGCARAVVAEGTHQSAAVGTPREGLENGEEDALGEVVPSVEPLRGVARGLSAPTRARDGSPRRSPNRPPAKAPRPRRPDDGACSRAHRRPPRRRRRRSRRWRARPSRDLPSRRSVECTRGRERVGGGNLSASTRDVEPERSQNQGWILSAPSAAGCTNTPSARERVRRRCGFVMSTIARARSAPRARASARSPRGLTPLARSLRAGHPGHARRRRRPSASFPRLASTSPATPRSATRTARIWRRSARACAFARLCARS